MPLTLKEHSRRDYTSRAEAACVDEIQAGAIQRIAAAVETIAQDRVRMEADLRRYKESCERYAATVARLRKSNAALRGCLRRAKNNAALPVVTDRDFA